MEQDEGLVIRGVLSDGTRNPDSTIAYTFGDLAQDNRLTQAWMRNGQPKCTAVLRPVTNDVQQRLQRKHTRKVASKNGINEEFDKGEYTLDLFDHLIVEWAGIFGEDGKPLVCTRKTKYLLDADRLGHMMAVASSNETSPEVEAASFREPA